MQLREWNARLHGLVVFRALLGDPVVAKLAALTDRLEAADDTIAPLCDAVAAFEAALFAHTTNLGDYLSNAVLETETVCVRQAAAGQLSPVMEAALNSELNFLQKLCGLTLDALLEAADRQNQELAFLPRWEARQLDLTAAYNNVAVPYNEIATAVNENGWMNDEQTATEMKALSDTLGFIGKGLTEDISLLDGSAFDALIDYLENEFPPALEELSERVSVPYEAG